MNAEVLVAAVLAAPLLGGLVLAWLGNRDYAPEINAAFSFGTLVASALLTVQIIAGGPVLVLGEQFFVDSLNVFLVALTAFVALTTALFSRPYMRIERDHGKMTPPRLRLYHSMYQFFSFTMLLALLTNNMGMLWVAMEAATLATVLLVGVYRTPASLEAAWKYFILCGVGIAQALFGTILLYLAADRVIGAAGGGLLWTHLDAVKTQLEPTVISLAFVFLLVGYGTKVGLVPLHNWLPDAHAEGPTPISAVLSGLLLNVALYAVLRCKVLADGALASRFAGDLMIGFGLLSVVVAAFFLSRQKDIKRMFAYSSIEHMGLITFAFGMGGPIASYAGLLHMTAHSLVKSAIFFAVGHAAQKAGTQLMDEIRGLIRVSPTVGWGLMLGTVAILGVPPFGVFASEFLILTTAMREFPWTTPFLLLALGVAFAAVFGKVQPMVFGDTTMKPLKHAPALVPVFVHIGLALMLGLFIPPYLDQWYRQAVQLVGG
ncbi:MAG TPA: hydrogenase 4 subunit F [Burkholderiaceae bacterium]|nr:hydrogenase 4 subunit F [Burkholderiaceae bacterium]